MLIVISGPPRFDARELVDLLKAMRGNAKGIACEIKAFTSLALDLCDFPGTIGSITPPPSSSSMAVWLLGIFGIFFSLAHFVGIRIGMPYLVVVGRTSAHSPESVTGTP